MADADAAGDADATRGRKREVTGLCSSE
jgi:hypothetical protein